jgi:putative ABC transport system substrate-binding protein
MIARRAFLGAALGLLAAPREVAAQPAPRPHRIGFLRVGQPPPTFIEPFREELRRLGWVEGRTLVIEYGLAQGVPHLPEVAAGLVRLPVEVLVASGTPSVLPAKNAAGTTPVVFVAAIDPVATGVVASLARPGGHVTGVSAVHADAMGKRLQLLKELLPGGSRIAFLVRTGSPATAQYVREAELGARALGLQLRVLSVREPGELEEAFAAAQGLSAVLQVDDAMLTAQRARIAGLALRHRLPTVSGLSETVEAGGLMSYGPHYGDLYRRAAGQVHRILQGARPADLPVEQPTRFELVINMRTARALGLVVPQWILVRADQLID